MKRMNWKALRIPLAYLLALVVLFSILPMHAMGADGEDEVPAEVYALVEREEIKPTDEGYLQSYTIVTDEDSVPLAKEGIHPNYAVGNYNVLGKEGGDVNEMLLDGEFEAISDFDNNMIIDGVTPFSLGLSGNWQTFSTIIVQTALRDDFGNYTVRHTDNSRFTEVGMSTPISPNTNVLNTANFVYNFEEWIVRSGTGTIENHLDQNTTFTSGSQLAVVWAVFTRTPEVVRHTVTYAANFGTNPTYEITYDEGDIIHTVRAFNKVFPTLNNDSYFFLGWSTVRSDIAEHQAGARIPVNVTLYAVWATTFTVGYVANIASIDAATYFGGYAAGTSHTVREFGVAFHNINIDGYKFIGWSETADSSDPIFPGTLLSRPATLYAVLVPAVTVTFDPNGGIRTSGGQLVQQVRIDGNAVPPIVARDGYTFAGWDPVGGYNDVTEDITLYAVWQQIPPGNGGTEPGPGNGGTDPGTGGADPGSNDDGTEPENGDIEPEPAALPVDPPVEPTVELVIEPVAVPVAAPLAAPLAAAPATPAAVADDDDEDDLVDIEDLAMALAPTPAEPEEPAEEPDPEPEADDNDDGAFIYIEDTEAPLAPFADGQWAMMNLILSIVSAALALMLGIRAFVKRKRQDREDEQTETLYANDRNKRGRLALILAVPIIAVLGIALFLLTQDMRLPMITMVDHWTIAHAIMTAASVLCYIFSYKRDKDEDTDNKAPKRAVA